MSVNSLVGIQFTLNFNETIEFTLKCLNCYTYIICKNVEQMEIPWESKIQLSQSNEFQMCSCMASLLSIPSLTFTCCCVYCNNETASTDRDAVWRKSQDQLVAKEKVWPGLFAMSVPNPFWLLNNTNVSLKIIPAYQYASLSSRHVSH